MSKPTALEGACLCGATKVSASPMEDNIGACHCYTCRKWGGGPFLSVHCNSEVSFSDTDAITVFASSEWAERGFCASCGSHLFYRLLSSGDYFIPAGLFDSVGDIAFDHQVFIDQKPSYYEFANETKNQTGEEVFAEFSDD